MTIPRLYRRRLIPDQLISLKDDKILYHDAEIIVTSWNTLNPKTEFTHGTSCYFLDKGIKISKFYRENNVLLYWYCDIVEYVYDESRKQLTVVDLLADVIVEPDGAYRVVDLDEMGDALEQGLLSGELLSRGLHRLDLLLKEIYAGGFSALQAVLEKHENADSAVTPSRT